MKPPEGPHRPVKAKGLLPTLHSPYSGHSQDYKVFEGCLALDSLNTEEKEPQKIYMSSTEAIASLLHTKKTFT